MLALYQPDIPQNCAALIRLAAAWQVPLAIIEPCGFILDDRRMARAELDYRQHADVRRFTNWASFRDATKERRLLLLSTRASVRYSDFQFQSDDVLLIGQESCGVPNDIHEAADARLWIPMLPTVRSLNAAMSATIVLSEMQRQCHWPYIATA